MQAEQVELQHLRRFASMMSWLAERGDLSLDILAAEVVVAVYKDIDGKRIRLCEIHSNNLERAMFEAMAAIHEQGSCGCGSEQKTT